MSVLHCGWVMLRIYCSKAKQMRLWPNLDRPVFEMNIVNEENKVTRHKLTQSFVLSLNVKPEFPEAKPTMFVIVNPEDNEPVNFWINKGRVDNFCLIMPNSQQS